MKKSIPFIDLKSQFKRIEQDIYKGITKVLDHGQYIMGPEVTELENQLAKFVGSEECITVSSGTDALLISLMALDIGPGDEVIVPAFTFVATAEVIALVGATPVFVDVEFNNCNIDPELIESKINKSTKAIIPVSLYGQPADMDKINAIAKRYDIKVIEDAAQSFGANYKNQKSCNLSDLGCTSFFPSKPLGCYGDGGAIFTSDKILAKKMREIRIHGQEDRYVYKHIGVGGRIDTLQCAILLSKLKVFNDEIALRSKIGEIYNKAFDSMGIRRVEIASHSSSVFAQYTIIIENREELSKFLLENDIPTAVHYPTPLNHQIPYQDFCCRECTPVSNELAKKVLSIPISPYLTEEDQERIIERIEFFQFKK